MNAKINQVFLVEMKPLLFGIAALLVGLPAHSETTPVQLETIPAQPESVYIIIRSFVSDADGISVDMHSLPMVSLQQCEEAGANLISSRRLTPKVGRQGWGAPIQKMGFECIEGK